MRSCKIIDTISIIFTFLDFWFLKNNQPTNETTPIKTKTPITAPIVTGEVPETERDSVF